MSARLTRIVAAIRHALSAPWASRRAATDAAPADRSATSTRAAATSGDASAAPTVDERELVSVAAHTSSAQEIRDGGYGIGSAAPLADGSTPLGHPVKAWEDTRTFAVADQEAYAAQPHVWFAGAEAAAAAGFNPAP